MGHLRRRISPAGVGVNPQASLHKLSSFSSKSAWRLLRLAFDWPVVRPRPHTNTTSRNFAPGGLCAGPHLTTTPALATSGVYENSGIGVRIQSERVYENPRNPQLGHFKSRGDISRTSPRPKREFRAAVVPLLAGAIPRTKALRKYEGPPSFKKFIAGSLKQTAKNQ